MALRHAVDQPNRRAFRCRANVNGERVAVHRAAGELLGVMDEQSGETKEEEVIHKER